MNKNKMLYVLPLFLLLAVSTVFAYPAIINGHSYATDGKTLKPFVNTFISCNYNYLIVTTNSGGYFATTYSEGLCDIGKYPPGDAAYLPV